MAHWRTLGFFEEREQLWGQPAIVLNPGCVMLPVGGDRRQGDLREALAVFEVIRVSQLG